MASGCGAWDDVERQFTLPRYQALWRYWRHHPPVHLMVAAYLGLAPDGPPPTGEVGLAELLATFGEGNIR
ncbi:hypothetical protein [Nitrospirillum iridis]|uniref:Uncharacterized protein n=1 Tax=Nitrospirillum iridis TaxID=765888 RepID=A0A7X0ECG9_9PROT|nr:hypothetical protein [Nitrospirillum iridis]MBB6251712.1 hypothetical protein [Nitrospirillum iridis]